MLRTKIFLIMVFASLIFTSSVSAGPLSPVSARIDIINVNENGTISVRLKFTLKNGSDHGVDILKWGTPFEDRFTSDCFEVKRKEERMPYLGILVKRGTPGAEDFISIAAGSEISKTIYLEDGYQIYKAGVYSVQYRENSLIMNIKSPDLENKRRTEKFSIQSNREEFLIIEGRSEPVLLGTPPTPSYCNAPGVPANYTKIFQSAHQAAVDIVLKAKQSLQSAPVAERPQARRYLEWFGSHSGSRYAAVTANFDRMYKVLSLNPGLMQQGTLAFCCSPENLYVYVYPSRPYYIYFGQQFWKAPLYGTDSMAGTFIGAVSMIDNVAGTRPNVNGQPGARNLARQNPDLAIKNTGNYAYFAENTPPLPMSSETDNSEGGSGGGSGGCFIQSIGCQK